MRLLRHKIKQQKLEFGNIDDMANCSTDYEKMSQYIKTEDIQRICRICLTTYSKELVPLRSSEDGGLTDMFTSLTSITELQEDIFPAQLCKLCRAEVVYCFQFRAKCIKSDNIIKSLLKTEITSKDDTVHSQKKISENKKNIGTKTQIKEEDEEVTDVQYLEDIDFSDDDALCLEQDIGNEKNAEVIGIDKKSKSSIEKVGAETKTKNRNHYCKICNKKFKKVKALRAHTKLKHEKSDDPNACGQCKEVFTTEHDLALHATVHSKGPVWHCIKCQKEFHTRTVFRRHVRRHMWRKRHACERCGKGFAERHALRRHARVHSGLPKPRPHACHLCDKRYSDASLLAAHLARHSGARPCACGACGKAFPSARLLASHALVHSDLKPHACRYCERRFRHESTLRTHLRTHTGEKPYVCSVCGKTFIQNSNLTLHMRTHTGERPYACLECGRRFTSGSSLKSHARTHTGEKPYACQLCGKRFARLDLRAHLRTHSGERPHACSACPKAFASAARLRDHTRVHTGEKPYECAMCPQKYPTKSHLAKHLKSHETKRKERKKVEARNLVILQRIDEDTPLVYTAADHDEVVMELGTLDGDIHKDLTVDIGEQVPLEVTGELVLQENGEVKTELVMVDDQNTAQNICLTSDGVNFVNNDISYGNNVNLVTVGEGEVSIATASAALERSVKLYQLDQSLVQIHSAGGQVTISQITSKMTANF